MSKISILKTFESMHLWLLLMKKMVLENVCLDLGHCKILLQFPLLEKWMENANAGQIGSKSWLAKQQTKCRLLSILTDVDKTHMETI